MTARFETVVIPILLKVEEAERGDRTIDIVGLAINLGLSPNVVDMDFKRALDAGLVEAVDITSVSQRYGSYINVRLTAEGAKAVGLWPADYLSPRGGQD